MSKQDVNMTKYVWIYDNRQGSEYVLYNTVRGYSTEPSQRTTIKRIGKIIIAFTIFVKHSILNLWQGSEYVLGFKHFRVLDIPEVSICQGSEFPELYRVDLFL